MREEIIYLGHDEVMSWGNEMKLSEGQMLRKGIQAGYKDVRVYNIHVVSETTGME